MELIHQKTITFGDQPLEVALADFGNGKQEVVIPLARLAEATEQSPQSLHQMIRRDALLTEYLINVTLISGKTACMQRPGVLLLVAKLNTTRIKDKRKAAQIQAFQRWAAETLDKSLFGEAQLPTLPSDPLQLFRITLEALEHNQARLTALEQHTQGLEQRLDNSPVSVDGQKAGHLHNLLKELAQTMGGNYSLA
jgi:hypothetical protein